MFPVPTLKTELTEALFQLVRMDASVVNCSRTTLASPKMEHLSLSTGTPMRKVQWQDSIQTHSSDSEFLHQSRGSFLPLNCSPESPVSTKVFTFTSV